MKELSTQLCDRVLRYDGVSVISPEMVAHCLLSNINPTLLRVTENTWEVSQFNQNVADDAQLRLSDPEPVNLHFSWQLPQPYLGWSAHDLDDYVSAAFERRAGVLLDSYTEEQSAAAVARICDELDEIHRRGMAEFMKTIIYVLEVFSESGTVWGVGRGSSCASYVLFILGLHSVDCVLYGVPMEEFFHD